MNSPLSTNEFIQFISPTLISIFGKASFDNLNEDSQTIIKEFIENPQKTFLMALKSNDNNGTIVFQLSYESSPGPILLCSKNSQIALPSHNFQSFIMLFPLPSGSVLSSLQSLIGQFFLPYFQTTDVKEENQESNENLAKGIIDSLSSFEIAVNRFQRKSTVPSPEFYVNPKSVDSNSKLTIGEENEILTKTDRWVTEARTLIEMAQNPPASLNLSEEISFWPQVLTNLKIVQGQCELFTSSNSLMSFITKYRKTFPEQLEKIQKAYPDLITKIEPFANAIIQFKIDQYSQTESLETFIENLKETFNFLLIFFKQCSLPQRISPLYKLTVQFLLTHLSRILSSIGFVRMQPDLFEVTMQSEKLLSQVWTTEEKELFDNTKISYATKTELKAIFAEKDKYLERITQFAQAKDDVFKITTHLQNHEEIDNIETQNALKNAFNSLLNSSSLLSLNPDANSRWTVNLTEFNNKLEKIEYDIAQSISALLIKCKTLNETRNIFLEHKILCKRPTIQVLLRQFEQPFILQINDQLDAFRKKELVNVSKLPIIMYYQTRGVPSDAAKLLHLRHISEQLKKFETMISDVVGDRWRDANECQSLIPIIDGCKDIIARASDPKKLAPNVFSNQEGILNKYLFIIEEKEHEKRLKCDYSQFNYYSFTSFRTLNEFRLVKELDVATNMMQLKKSYRSYARIYESLTQFISTLKTMDDKLRLIAVDQISSIYQQISEGWALKWNANETPKYSKDFAKAVSAFALCISSSSKIMSQINDNLSKFDKAKSYEDVSALIDDTISKVDQLFYSKLTNEDKFISDLNKQIAEIIKKCVNSICNEWIEALKNRTKLPIDPIQLRISIQSKHILIMPPAELLHSIIYKAFTREINNFVRQKKSQLMQQKRNITNPFYLFHMTKSTQYIN